MKGEKNRFGLLTGFWDFLSKEGADFSGQNVSEEDSEYLDSSKSTATELEPLWTMVYVKCQTGAIIRFKFSTFSC